MSMTSRRASPCRLCNVVDLLESASMRSFICLSDEEGDDVSRLSILVPSHLQL